MKKRKLSLEMFPNSAAEPFLVTSEWDENYNCIAWVLGIQNAFIWPRIGQFDWLTDLPRVETRENFLAFFKKHGFEICENGEPKRGFEKIAFFEKDGQPTHAARLVKKGIWSSKIGVLEDVRHSLLAISGGIYGDVVLFLEQKKGPKTA